MGPSKYSQQQRDAIAAAVNERGLTAREVKEAAECGELQDGLGEFEPTINSIRHIAAKAIRDREPGKDPTATIESAVKKAAEAAALEVEVCLQRQAEGENVARELRDAVKALEAAAQFRPVKTAKAAPSPDETPDGALAAQIAAEAAKSDKAAINAAGNGTAQHDQDDDNRQRERESSAAGVL